METCKVEFNDEQGQKIIIDFTLEDNGDLNYKPSFDPQLTDPKKNLGLSGQLCEVFIQALHRDNNEEDMQIEDGKGTELKN